MAINPDELIFPQTEKLYNRFIALDLFNKARVANVLLACLMGRSQALDDFEPAHLAVLEVVVKEHQEQIFYLFNELEAALNQIEAPRESTISNA